VRRYEGRGDWLKKGVIGDWEKREFEKIKAVNPTQNRYGPRNLNPSDAQLKKNNFLKMSLYLFPGFGL
jgi:hypothetical protein